ncbi:Protein FAR1-RELATED SEQUENCE 5 [Bienertia sinuspersici]
MHQTPTMTFTPRLCLTSKGSKEWIPCCPLELKLVVGMLFDTLADGIQFYKQYACFCGFVRRLRPEKKDDDGNALLKYVYSNKEGYNDNGSKKSNTTNKSGNQGKFVSSFTSEKRSVNRAGCEARIVSREEKKANIWYIFFHESHNHLFGTPNSKHFLKNSRNVTLAHKKFIFNNARLNIGPNKSYRLMKEHVGGYESVGATLVDFKNFSRDMKSYVREVDATMFINNLKEKVKNSVGGFFFDYCVNEKGNLTRIFWADAISRINYFVFGDMLSFVTTYDTNTYSMVFAPFTGLDHHGKCVTFGVGLLANEDVDSFTWLFQCFLKGMDGFKPTCLMTGQDPAMKVTINKVFIHVKHRSCMWHIMKKVPNKVGPLLCNETDFLKKLSEVVWNKDLEPEEFNAGWHSVMSELGLQNHEWFVKMFDMKDQWIPSYFRNQFMGGILRSSQISESENNFFNEFTNTNCLLLGLWFRYESTMDCQRHTQDKLNSDTKNSMPCLVTTLHLEKHASFFYTHNLFYKFQHEFQHVVFNCRVLKANLVEGIDEFEINDNTRKKTYSVTYVVDGANCYCSCKMFESMGILCRHILFVMKGKFLIEIPNQYLLNR